MIESSPLYVKDKSSLTFEMEIPEFRLEEFVLDGGFNGEGGQAKVYKGFHSSHGNVAIKQWFSDPDNMRNEMELLKQNAYHQNIVQFLGILINDKSKCIGYVMPYMPMGSLHDVIHDKSQQYDQKEIKSWITQICYGLSYLHGKQIIHRDIKPSNVLLGRCYDDVKVSDFGMARSLNNITSTLTGGLGTFLYTAPEILRGDRYDVSVDVYSLSITIWEILYRRCPYDCATGVFEFMNRVTQGERPQLGSNLSKEESDLLMSCWNADASKRPTVDYVGECCSTTTFSLIDFGNSVNECTTSFENLDVHDNNNESFSKTITANSVQSTNVHNNITAEPREALNDSKALSNISLDKQNENFPIPNLVEEICDKQTILLLGDDSLLILENNQQNWKQLDIKLPYPMGSHGAQFLHNTLYIFGGVIKWNPSNWTYKLSESLQWEKMADMNKKRWRITNSSVILNNQIWVCGGENKEERLKSVEMYDPLTNKWKYMKEMNQCRTDAAAAVVNGKIFCSDCNSVECYDPSSDVWAFICYMPQFLHGHGAVEIDGHFVIIGGDHGGYLKNVWALDTTDESAKWIEKLSMSIPRKDFSVTKIDGKIFVCGGHGAWDNVEIFDGKVWSNGPKMPVPRFCAAAIAIPMEFAKQLIEDNSIADDDLDSLSIFYSTF